MPESSTTLQERVDALRWYHRMELPGGVVTQGVVNVDRVLPRLSLPDSLTGKSVLDVRAWDGFYSSGLPFAAARLFPRRELLDGPTDWFQLGNSALSGLLAEFGFGVVYRRPMHQRRGRAAVQVRRCKAFRKRLRSNRVVVHARRTSPI